MRTRRLKYTCMGSKKKKRVKECAEKENDWSEKWHNERRANERQNYQ